MLNQNIAIEVVLLSYWFSGGSKVLKKVVTTKKKMKMKSGIKKYMGNITSINRLLHKLA